MCKKDDPTTTTTKKKMMKEAIATPSTATTTSSTAPSVLVERRGKRDKDGQFFILSTDDKERKKKRTGTSSLLSSAVKKNSKTTTASTSTSNSSTARSRHSQDKPSGGMESLLPSLIGVAVLVFAVMAQRGFRGRATVAGIDLGTTNSVVCIQAPSKTVGQIDCVSDPYSESPIIPSVVSFLAPQERKVGPSSKVPSKLNPHPSHVVVGQKAKQRISSHPHHTLYNAKRVLGRTYKDEAVHELQQEVEFDIVTNGRSRTDHQQDNDADKEDADGGGDNVRFRIVPYEDTSSSSSSSLLIPPQQVGAYIVNHLMSITSQYLGHNNVQSAVLAVPAKFDSLQRQRTMEAFQLAGVKIARVLEEPTAAALAYGLHKKDGVEKILVYDFGGGTLDISILHVSEGYAEVMGSDGDDRLGGADFDVAVAHYLTEQHRDILKTVQRYEDNHHVPNDDNNDKERGLGAKFDIVEALADQCDRITDEQPLCSVSSFHTLGEGLKISLSRQLLDQDEKRNENNDEQELASSLSSSIVAKTSCWALQELSTSSSPDDETNKEILLKRLCDTLQHQDLSITLEEYNKVAQPLYDRSIVPVTRLLEDLTLKPDEIDEIVMVGGTTRMPQIRTLVRDAFSSAQLNTHIDPDITVAFGAASVVD